MVDISTSLNVRKAFKTLRSLYGLLGDKQKQGFMQDKLEVYESMVNVLMKEKKIEKAEKYLNESKMFLLRLEKGDTQTDLKDENVKRHYQELVQQKQEIANLEKKIQEAKNPSQEELLKQKRLELAKHYQKKLGRQASLMPRRLFFVYYP
ncbi:MAG: hypothetical protein KDK90_24945 [Leptospiraceae bacterium]|nr:hypothetical protein [Leptospiraceae bacterium]